MWEYIVKAAAAWLLGFAPFVEIYIAIPVAVAMGLDYVSAVVWSVFGNFAPVPLIVLWYEKLLQRKRLGPWLKRLSSGRGRRILDRHGPWFLIVVTPWIGIWPVAAAARALGMPRARVMLYSFISVTIHGVLLAVLIAMGVDWFTGHDSHRKPSTNESFSQAAVALHACCLDGRGGIGSRQFGTVPSERYVVRRDR